MKGKDAGKELGLKRMRLAQSGGIYRGQSGQALQEVQMGTCYKRGSLFMGSCVCCAWGAFCARSCEAAVSIYRGADEVFQQHEELTFSQSRVRAATPAWGRLSVSAFLHAVCWRCHRVVWDEVRSPGGSLRVQSPSCWQVPPPFCRGIPQGDQPPSWLPFCIRIPAGSALLVPLPILWGMCVIQSERAGQQVTPAHHLQGFEA